jgi:hypothetical protein
MSTLSFRRFRRSTIIVDEGISQAFITGDTSSLTKDTQEDIANIEKQLTNESMDSEKEDGDTDDGGADDGVDDELEFSEEDEESTEDEETASEDLLEDKNLRCDKKNKRKAWKACEASVPQLDCMQMVN